MPLFTFKPDPDAPFEISGNDKPEESSVWPKLLTAGVIVGGFFVLFGQEEPKENIEFTKVAR